MSIFLLYSKRLIDLPQKEILDLRKTKLVLQSRTKPTCGLFLVEGSLEQIKDYCRYFVVRSSIPRGLFMLTKDLILLSNISSLTIQCVNQTSSEVVKLNHPQVVQSLHCSCEMFADEFYLPRASLLCDAIDNVSATFEPTYLLNLPYITEFF